VAPDFHRHVNHLDVYWLMSSFLVFHALEPAPAPNLRVRKEESEAERWNCYSIFTACGHRSGLDETRESGQQQTGSTIHSG
jgi:hypothetical protein